MVLLIYHINLYYKLLALYKNLTAHMSNIDYIDFIKYDLG
jgi:hypothetical protein